MTRRSWYETHALPPDAGLIPTVQANDGRHRADLLQRERVELRPHGRDRVVALVPRRCGGEVEGAELAVDRGAIQVDLPEQGVARARDEAAQPAGVHPQALR